MVAGESCYITRGPGLIDNRQVSEQNLSAQQNALPQPHGGSRKRYALTWAIAGSVVIAIVVTVLVVVPHDSDGDGLPDGLERSGWRSIAGAVYVTDPFSLDTDGDGLSDAQEAGDLISKSSDEPVYDSLSNPIKADSDDDGLSDKTEHDGWRRKDGAIYRTEPMNSDTDNDGLSDGEEAGTPIAGSGILEFEVVSSPIEPDSDGDGLGGLDEYDLGTELWLLDTDGDGLSDFQEVELYNTDPRARDSDGDSYQDDYELHHKAEGFSPLDAEIVPEPEQWAEDFYIGAVKGEFEQRDSIAWLAGNVTQGGTIFIPVVGEVVGTAGDLRDALAQTLRGEYGEAAWSAIGLTPVLGLAALSPRIAKFVKRAPNLRVQVDLLIDKLEIDDGWKISLRKVVWGSAWEKLTGRGFTDKQVNALDPIRRKYLLEEFQERPSSIGSSAGEIGGKDRGEIGRNAEAAYLAEQTAAKRRNLKTQESVGVPGSCGTTCGQRPTRRFDVCSGKTAKLSCAEIKAGYTPYSTHVREEIARDAYLLKNGHVKQIEYHFYWSKGSGSIGADPKVLELLRQHGIPYKIHPPA